MATPDSKEKNTVKDKDEIIRLMSELRKRIIELAMLANIIDPYFDDFEINKKTEPFAFVMQNTFSFIAGKTCCLLFDVSNKNSVVSIQQLYNDLKNYSRNNDTEGKKHLKYFDSAGEIFEQIKTDHYGNLKFYRDKYFAHHELVEKERKKILIPWHTHLTIIQDMEKIYQNMYLYWSGSSTNMAKNQRDEWKKGFWNMIKTTD